jgi:RNA polymerase sigma-70 factor (ECF subfamily)
MGHHDTELIQRWQSGDTVAFEELVRRWQQPIARFLARQVGRLELVPDLCQEVFVRVYRAGPRYRDAGAFSSWLYRIALNVARDAGKRRRPTTLPLPYPEPAAAGLSAQTRCERLEMAAAVERALAELPPALREVLVLRHYEGMNFEQMARLLGRSASTLKSRFTVALNRLRVRLEQQGWNHQEIEP